MVLVDPREQQGAVVHDDDILGLIGLQQTLVLRPGNILKGRVGLYVALHHAGQAEGEVLHGWSKRYFGWICENFPKWTIVIFES